MQVWYSKVFLFGKELESIKSEMVEDIFSVQKKEVEILKRIPFWKRLFCRIQWVPCLICGPRFGM